MFCRYCGLDSSYKNGFVKGKQRYKCKNCGKTFQEKDGRTKESTLAKQALAIALYTMCRASYNFLAKKIFKCSPTTIMNWIKKGAKTAKIPKISDDIKEIEFDEMWHFLERKENQKWIFKAVDRVKKKTVAWVTGKHDVATFKKLYDQVKHLKKCKYYTDGWSGLAKVLPKRHHVIGKELVTTIEQNNSKTRHYLGRMIRRTKIVSKMNEMPNASMKLLFSLSFD